MTRFKANSKFVPAKAVTHDDFSQELGEALVRLVSDPTPAPASTELLVELFATGLIEWHHFGIRFTESGRRTLHRLRDTSGSQKN